MFPPHKSSTTLKLNTIKSSIETEHNQIEYKTEHNQIEYKNCTFQIISIVLSYFLSLNSFNWPANMAARPAAPAPSTTTEK